MALTKKHNHDYSGEFPKTVGDRYYAQDLGRDFNYLLDQTGLLLSDFSGMLKGIQNGWYPNTVGALNDCINITAGVGYAPYNVTVPGTPFIIPPTPVTETMSLIRIFSALVNNFSLVTSGATGNGSTPNYLKIKFSYSDNDTRTRAKKAGSYYYNQTPSYTITCDATPPTSKELCLADIVWNSVSHAITITYTDRTVPINVGDATVVITPSGGDDGVLFNNIISWLSVIGGGSIKMQKGTYLISTQINWKSKINLIGQGNNTIIKRNSSTPTQLFYIDNAITDYTLSDFSIDGNGLVYTPANSYGIYCLNNTSNTNGKYKNIYSFNHVGASSQNDFVNCQLMENCIGISSGNPYYNCGYMLNYSAFVLTSGSGNWTSPQTGLAIISITSGGGGGGGGTASVGSGGAGGGAGGTIILIMNLIKNRTYPYVIGTGGVGGGTTVAGSNGTASSFNGMSAPIGNGGAAGPVGTGGAGGAGGGGGGGSTSGTGGSTSAISTGNNIGAQGGAGGSSNSNGAIGTLGGLGGNLGGSSGGGGGFGSTGGNGSTFGGGGGGGYFLNPNYSGSGGNAGSSGSVPGGGGGGASVGAGGNNSGTGGNGLVSISFIKLQ